MIENIEIKNFKSIIKDRIVLKPLTVLVGANGSGKSNLIKALEFIGTIPRSGVADAAIHFGGFSGIIPKSIPKRYLDSTRIELNYTTVLPSPSPDEKIAQYIPPITVDHKLELSHSSKEIVSITSEKLTFHQVLAVAKIMDAESSEDIEKENLSEPSSFTLERGPRGGLSYYGCPPFIEAIPDYLVWLGLPVLRENIKTVTHFEAALKRIMGPIRERDRRNQLRQQRQRYQSFLDPGLSTIVDYAPQARIFRRLITSIRRYDFLMNELRKEQSVSDSPIMSNSGNNMPSVLRRLRSNSRREASWNRIRDSLDTIAPHISAMKSSPLRADKEFVEFVEDIAGRGVESWESSDGTLRALAILLALETHATSSTILIEEPELNLHPWAIRKIIEHAREAIKERSLQVIITTHSQQVLERVYPDEVLVATRTRKEGTKFHTLKQILPDRTEIMMGEVGELWVGGLLGGVPTVE